MLIEATDAAFDCLIEQRPPTGLRLAEGGLEAAPILSMLRDLARTIRPQVSPAAWMIVEAGEVVGLCSIVAVGAPGVIEIGYGVAASRRGQGFARTAIADVLDWARAQYWIERVTADTAVLNVASQRVLERNGFTHNGTRTDAEDGEMICWCARPKAQPDPSAPAA